MLQHVKDKAQALTLRYCTDNHKSQLPILPKALRVLRSWLVNVGLSLKKCFWLFSVGRTWMIFAIMLPHFLLPNLGNKSVRILLSTYTVYKHCTETSSSVLDIWPDIFKQTDKD